MQSFGNQGTGDHAKMSDKMGRGGVHGAKDCYNHRDLATTNHFFIPVSAMDNVQTLKAFNHVYGDYPRLNYDSDNVKRLDFAASSNGLRAENH